MSQPRPQPVVGIVGAGQLARMMLQAAIPLAVPIRLLAARPDDGAALVARDVVVGSPDDPEALSAFAADCTVLTFDHELVSPIALARLDAEGVSLRPSAQTMLLAQNKRRQREDLGRLGLPIPPFRLVDGVNDVTDFGKKHGWPLVVKSVRGGYDGRGVWIVEDVARTVETVGALLAESVELLVEQWVPIERELAILVARRPSGEVVTYPVVETVQVGGICREIAAPAPVPDELCRQAEAIARTVAEAVDLVGILAVELFVAGGRLLVNELATRPHNSGHYSIEGCVTSQFEQHLRAILDWPLGATALTAPSVVTVNVLGEPDGVAPETRLPAALAIEGVHVHLYGKSARPGRKLGHVTALGVESATARERARRAAAILTGAPVEAVV